MISVKILCAFILLATFTDILFFRTMSYLFLGLMISVTLLAVLFLLALSSNHFKNLSNIPLKAMKQELALVLGTGLVVFINSDYKLAAPIAGLVTTVALMIILIDQKTP